MVPSSTLMQRPSWPERRTTVSLRETGRSGVPPAAPLSLLLAQRIQTLLPPGHPAPPQDWCADVLERGGCSRRCLEPHDSLSCAVEIVLLGFESHGRIALITVRDAADAMRDARWQSAARMEVMVHTVGILAHKTNNTLTSVLGNAEYLADMTSLPEDAVQSAQLIMKAVEKLELQTRRIGHLTALSRPGPGRCDPAVELVHRTERSRAGLPLDLTLTVEASVGQGLILVEPSAFQQAVGELIDNALTAAARPGRVRLSAALRKEVAWPGFGWMEISVADDGPGFDLHLARATAEGLLGAARRGNILPLGLPIVHAFAHALGGQLIAERPASGGTRLTLCLPALLPGCEWDMLQATPLAVVGP